MNKKEKELIGALIGLAKACNVHLKTENTDNIIIQSLACIFESDKEQQLEEFLQKVRKEKRNHYIARKAHHLRVPWPALRCNLGD